MPEVIKLSQEWEIRERIASGGFGIVYDAESSSGDSAVVKLVPKTPGAERELLFEDLDGVPNVVPVIDRGSWEDYWVLVMQKAEKSLREYLIDMGGTLSIRFAAQILADITVALTAIEGRIVHRDIKPDNILLLDGRWSLADFGIARYAEATTSPDTRKYAMTPQYAAPEQWRGQNVSSATDVYAMGIVAHEMLAGEPPFRGPEIHHYHQQHLREDPGSIPGIPPKLQSLIHECLYKAPQSRPTPQNLSGRWAESLQEASDAGRRLQQANALAVQSQAESDRQQSIAQSEDDRRRELYDAAKQSFAYVVSTIHNQIILNAPVSGQSDTATTSSWTLNNATLTVAPLRRMDRRRKASDYDPPIDVVAYSHISLRIPPDRSGYGGRSHSLWYCDAQESGIFRWYETAFMINPFIPERRQFDPFSMDPDDDAYLALSPVMDVHQVAWPFTAIDQGGESPFIERWIGSFADAAQGQLRHPTRMPERDPTGSWRRGE